MKYIEDIKREYEQDIIKHLRAHNNLFVGDRESAEYYFYALKGHQPVGRVHTSLFWDWVTLKNMFYKDSSILSTLLNTISQHYDDAVGIKCFTHIPKREKELIRAGLKIGGHTVKTDRIPSYTLLKSTKREFEFNKNIQVIVSETKIDEYELVFDDNKTKTHPSNTTDVFFVALEDNTFAGGVHGIIEEDSMYISRLSVNPKFRKHGIGFKLMLMAEQRAQSLNLYNMTTGTCSFQAKDFYIKLGYEIVFTKENDPKGYESYSLEKRLKK